MIKVFINFNDAFSFLKEINDGKIRLEKGQKKKNQNQKNLIIRFEWNGKGKKKNMKWVKKCIIQYWDKLKSTKLLLNFQMILRQRYLRLNKAIHGERRQIWTLKQMLQKLPITIMQVKAGNTVNKTFFLSNKWNY